MHRTRTVRFIGGEMHSSHRGAVSDAGTKTRTQAPTRTAAGPAARSVAPIGEAPGFDAVPVVSLQRSAGNRAVSGLVRTSIAYQSLQRCSCSSGAGKCARCQQEDEEVLQRLAEPGASSATGAPQSMVRSVLSTPGQPLDAGLRQDMEGHFGTSLGHVRVHTDSAAAESAAAVEARAYTVGQHIVFSASSWAPHTRAGRHLLAHELAHTVQQRGARGGVQRLAVDPGGRESPAEREADAAASSVTKGNDVPSIHRMSSALQRFPVTKEPVGGCGICSKEQFGGGWQKKVGQKAHDVVQTVALGVAMFTSNALMQKELPITQKRRKLPKKLPRITSPTDTDNGRLDLAVPTPTGFAIAEIKPSTPHGEEEGLKDLDYYERIIQMRYPGATVERLRLVIPGPIPFIDTLALKAGCTQQMLAAMLMAPGLIGYFCEPPFSMARKSCSCKKKKKDKKKEKKKDKKKDNKKSKKKDTKKPKKTKATKKKPPKKKPAARKTAKPKGPGAKGASLSLGISIGSSGSGAANIGVGISVNSSGTSIGTVSASVSYDSDGNVIGAVGAGATSRSSGDLAGGAGATAADQSSSEGLGVATVGTADKSSSMGAGVVSQGNLKGSDVKGALVKSKGSGENITGTGVKVKTSGDAKDVDVNDAKSGTAAPGKTGTGEKSGKQGEKEGAEEEESEAGEKSGEATSPGTSGDDIRNTEAFKQAQAEAKRMEAAFAKATPAQQKLMMELVKKYPDHVMPVPDERFVQKWLNATAGVKDQDVDKIASQPWAQGTDIDEAEFKRRVEAAIKGESIKADEASPSPTPPPEKKPPKTPPKKDAQPKFKSVANLIKEAGGTQEDLRTQLQEKAKAYDYSNVDVFESHYDKDDKGAQTRLFYFKSPNGNSVALVVFTMKKKGGKDYIKVLDASDAVTVDGKVFRPLFVGHELAITIQ